jgi:ABC-type transport system involved in multi-copper enzyme maturation permease subunit
MSNSPPLPYATPTPPPGDNRAWAKFFVGAIGGVIFSSLYYFILIGVNPNGPGDEMLYLGAIGLKFFVGFGLLFHRQWRPLGIGLIASIPLAILTVIGICFALVAAN